MRLSPTDKSTIKTANGQIYIDIPKEVSVISLMNRYHDFTFH